MQIVKAGKVIIDSENCVFYGFDFQGSDYQEAAICAAQWTIDRLEAEIEKLKDIVARGNTYSVDFTSKG